MRNEESESNIRNLLLEIGVPTNLRGFPYLVYAETLIVENQDYMVGITKALYIDIAKQFHTSADSVERCIRHAIRVGWVAIKPETKDRIFKNSLRSNRTIPSNGQFITMLYYYLIEQH